MKVRHLVLLLGCLLTVSGFVCGMFAVWTHDHDLNVRLTNTAFLLGVPGVFLALGAFLAGMEDW